MYAKEGLPFPPGPFWGGRFELLTGKSDHSPPDQIDAVFKKVILFPKSYHLPPPLYNLQGIWAFVGAASGFVFSRSSIGCTHALPI